RDAAAAPPERAPSAAPLGELGGEASRALLDVDLDDGEALVPLREPALLFGEPACALGERGDQLLGSPLLLLDGGELVADERLELLREPALVLVELLPRSRELPVARGDLARLLAKRPLALDELRERGAARLEPRELLLQRVEVRRECIRGPLRHRAGCYFATSLATRKSLEVRSIHPEN